MIDSMSKAAPMAGLALAVLLTLSGPAHAATVIYQDSFSGSAAAPLNGQAPSQGGNTWTTTQTNGGITVPGTYWFADGSYVGSTSAVFGGAYLPFTPELGKFYTLSLEFSSVSYLAASPGYLGVGFSSAANGLPGSLGPWLNRNSDNLNGTTFRNGASGSGGNAVTYAGTGSPTVSSMTITLDTTDTYWTAEYFYNDVLLRTVTYDASHPNPTITQIAMFGYRGPLLDGATIELTVVPEPSVLSFMAVGSLGLVVLVRRRRVLAS